MESCFITGTRSAKELKAGNGAGLQHFSLPKCFGHTLPIVKR